MGIANAQLNQRAYRPEESRIVFSTACSGLMSHIPLRGRQTPAEIKETDEIMSVVRAQPHRRGSDDARLSEPLGRFCAVQRLREECYRAGSQYGEIVRQAKAAMGFRVPGLVPNKEGLPLTDDQIEAIKIAALQRLDNANCVLVAVMYRLPRAMEKLCYDQLEISPYDEGIITAGLLDLADFFGILDRGINAGKRI